MTAKTRPYDSARYLNSEEAIEEYLTATCEDGTPAEIAHALGVIARARGISDLARQTGLTGRELERAVSGDGDPAFATIARIAKALGFRLKFEPAVKDERSAA